MRPSPDLPPAIALALFDLARGAFAGELAPGQRLGEAAGVAGHRPAFEPADGPAAGIKPRDRPTILVLDARLVIDLHAAHGVGDAGAKRHREERRGADRQRLRSPGMTEIGGTLWV